jgi:hypothetical protein
VVACCRVDGGKEDAPRGIGHELNRGQKTDAKVTP